MATFTVTAARWRERRWLCSVLVLVLILTVAPAGMNPVMADSEPDLAASTFTAVSDEVILFGLVDLTATVVDTTGTPVQGTAVAMYVKLPFLPPGEQYVDLRTVVDPTSVHGPAIGCRTERGIFAGRTTDHFAPNSWITRGQLATLIVRTFGLNEALSVDGDETTTLSAMHADSAAILKHAGILTGYADGSMRLNRPATRAEAASIVARAAGLASDTNSVFVDVACGNHAGAISALAGLQMLNGLPDGSFRPSQPMSRAQIASLLDHFGSRQSAN